jgi:hypothetical protein
MTRHVMIALLIASGAAACGDLSPAAPTDIERELRLQVFPVRPLRVSTSSVLYILDYSVFNPRVATGPVTVTRVEFTIFGADGTAYSNTADQSLTFGRTAALRPGEGRSGNGIVTDVNVTRPSATRYTVRVLFTRPDGSTWALEDEAAILP